VVPAILEDVSFPLRPLINLESAREIIETDARAFNPAWFGQLMGGAQFFAYLIQIDAWLRECRVRIRV